MYVNKTLNIQYQTSEAVGRTLKPPSMNTKYVLTCYLLGKKTIMSYMGHLLETISFVSSYTILLCVCLFFHTICYFYMCRTHVQTLI